MKPNAPPPQFVMSPLLLANGPQAKEELRHFEHQVHDRLALAAHARTCRFPLSHHRHPFRSVAAD